MTVATGLITASGYASMLEESDPKVQLAALEQINKVRTILLYIFTSL